MKKISERAVELMVSRHKTDRYSSGETVFEYCAKRFEEYPNTKACGAQDLAQALDEYQAELEELFGRACADCSAQSLPKSRWCAMHTPEDCFIPATMTCDRCGEVLSAHMQYRDGKPPRCPRKQSSD